MYEHITSPDFKPTQCIGSFESPVDDDFKQTIRAAFEHFSNGLQINPNMNMATILTTEGLYKDYKDQLFGDVLTAESTSSFDHYAGGNDEYTSMNAQKLEQLIENSRQVMVTEASTVGQLSPIVTVTMPLLKKEYILNQFKDMVHNLVSPVPIIKYGYERRFLKDAAGNKKYFPECFYDGSYAEFTDQTVGKKISNKWYPETGSLPLVDLNMLEESGGSLSKRDALSYDFGIDGIKVTVPSDAGEGGVEEVTVTGLDIRPDYAQATFFKDIEIPSKKAAITDPTVIHIYGTVDFYAGIVNVSVSPNDSTIDVTKIKVRFGGHLSNSNNDAVIELDKERKNRQFTIAEKERFNTGLTIEKIRDEKALANIDVTVELISDMSDVCAQTADSNIQRYLEDSFVQTKAVESTRVFQPMGYNFIFADEFEFSLEAPGPYQIPEADWRSKQLRFYFERVLAYLKTKLRDERIMFAVSANTFVLELLSATDSGIKWIMDSNASVGGVKLDYKFGVTTVNGTRVQFIATQKEEIQKGFRITVIPLTDTIITYRQYTYAFNIETSYRNAITPNIPNVMAVSRYENVCVLPIQSNFYIKEYREGNLGTSPQNVYKNYMSVNGLL